MTNNEYYVYFFLRQDGTPYYIGKGKGNRAYSFGRKRIKRPKSNDRITIQMKYLTEQQAFIAEKYYIAKYGRKDNGTGILHNRTDGGEGASGAKHIGRKYSEEYKKTMGKHRIGKKLPETTRQKMSESQKNRWNNLDDEIKKEIKKRISEQNKGKQRTESAKSKISEHFNGSIYINNGKENKRIKSGGIIPEGWKKGRLPYKTKRILSEETKRKIGNANKISLLGNIPWNKGKKVGSYIDRNTNTLDKFFNGDTNEYS